MATAWDHSGTGDAEEAKSPPCPLSGNPSSGLQLPISKMCTFISGGHGNEARHFRFIFPDSGRNLYTFVKGQQLKLLAVGGSFLASRDFGVGSAASSSSLGLIGTFLKFIVSGQVHPVGYFQRTRRVLHQSCHLAAPSQSSTFPISS